MAFSYPALPIFLDFVLVVDMILVLDGAHLHHFSLQFYVLSRSLRLLFILCQFIQLLLVIGLVVFGFHLPEDALILFGDIGSARKVV